MTKKPTLLVQFCFQGTRITIDPIRPEYVAKGLHTVLEIPTEVHDEYLKLQHQFNLNQNDLLQYFKVAKKKRETYDWDWQNYTLP